MIYLLDTNTISDLIGLQQNVWKQFRVRLVEGHRLAICPPVYYELRRGLLWKNHNRKLTQLNDIVMPQLEWIQFTDNDWVQASQFWADVTTKGRAVDEIDLFIAAMAHRLDAVVVTSDNDFDALPIKRENWR